MTLTFAPGADATFIAGASGQPPALALWGTGVASDDTVELVVPAGSQVRRRRVPARLLPLAEVLDPLCALPADAEVTASVRAWSVAAKLALDLVARGRLLPSIAADGTDRWVLGPLDPDDHRRLDQLAAALPAAAHAVPIPATTPRRIVSPRTAVAGFVDAVADAFVRTAAAPTHAGHPAYAAGDPVDVAAQRDWLRSVTGGASSAASAVLRVQLPAAEGRPSECVVEVHSRIDPGLVVPAADLWAAPEAVAARFGADVDAELLVTLRRAARVWPPIARLLAEVRPDRLVLEPDEEHELLGPIADDLAAAGLPVLWPTELFSRLEVRSVVTTPQVGKVAAAGFDLRTLGELRWRASIDGEDLTDAEMKVLAEAKRPVVRMRGRWVRADPDRLRRAQEARELRAGDVLAAALTGSVAIDGEEVEAELEEGPLRGLVDRLDAVHSRTLDWRPPTGLVAELRPYQRRGVQWLAEMADLGLGGVLADDMGLGKTLQVLALHLHRNGVGGTGPSGPTLVVCPASLLGNWEREAARFAPGVAIRRHHGTDRALGLVAPGEIVVTTYGVVRRDAASLAAVGWDLVVADEAQAVKNPLSRTAQALRRIPARARFALTGTPVENRLVDLWALLDWTTPGLLGRLDVFRRTVAIPVEREGDEHVADRLATIVRPFLLRRRKSDPEIAPDLPPKTETDRFVGLTAEQASLYTAVTEELVAEVERTDGMQRRGLILKLLTALKQICNHPAQYLRQDGPTAGRSAKLDAVTELLGVIVDEGDAALVFTQYVAMGHLLERHLASAGIETAFLHGGTSVTRRQEMVDDFQAGRPPVLLVSLKAGGTGLNLTRATHVVHFDRWWNPAVEDQASDRAWRIGQDRPVQVHRMVCEGTMEERLALVLESKRSLAESVVGGGEGWITDLSDAELAELVALGGGA